MATVAKSRGVVLNVDLQSENAFGQLAIPIAATSGDITNKQLSCKNAVMAFLGSDIPMAGSPAFKLLSCLSEETSLIGVGATGIDTGMIPYRVNFDQGDYPGLMSPGVDCEPSAVTVITHFYPDPADLDVGERLMSGRNYIFGIPEDQTGGNVITGALKTAVEAFANSLIDGALAYDLTPEGGQNLTWKRVVSAARISPNALLRIVSSIVVKTIIGTVKSRLSPPKR